MMDYYENHYDIYDQALKSWGFDAQMDVCVEELSELIKALLKYRRKPTMEKAIDIAEEMADAIIMIQQMRIAMVEKYPEFPTWELEMANQKLRRVKAMLSDESNN